MGLFFLPTEEHLHSSHLLRRDCVYCVCTHMLAYFMCERLASAACVFPQVYVSVQMFNVMQRRQPEQTEGGN